MTEANHNANSFNSELNLGLSKTEHDNLEDKRVEASAAENSSGLEDNSLSVDSPPEAAVRQNCDSDSSITRSSDEQKMNWQKVAHKLREYNRKLLKKVFRLEQELADIDNKFSKYVEKSRSSDVLVAQQEKEIRQYREEAALFDSKQANLQIAIDQKEITIANLSQQYELSQQQTAQLERECALLQENYNDRVYELTTKDREIKDLQNKLNQQQRSALQYKAELQRYQEKLAASTPTSTPTISIKEPVIPRRQSHSHQKTIAPWSTSNISETKITLLPKEKSQSIPARKTARSKAIETAAQIATWSASQPQEKPSKTNPTTAKPRSSVRVKPKSLAAVDLPTFPRKM